MMKEHKGQVIPIPENRQFAYQSENSYPGCYIKAWLSHRDTSDEAKTYNEYEFIITKMTDTAMSVTLRKHRRDTVAQRIENGAAVRYEEYHTILDFAELVNRIFGPGCAVYEESEVFPDSVREVMKQAYEPKREG